MVLEPSAASLILELFRNLSLCTTELLALLKVNPKYWIYTILGNSEIDLGLKKSMTQKREIR